ncbi:cytosolic 5'-nucleotidase 1A-like isoform X2, partial [Lates japonicus]
MSRASSPPAVPPAPATAAVDIIPAAMPAEVKPMAPRTMGAETTAPRGHRQGDRGREFEELQKSGLNRGEMSDKKRSAERKSSSGEDANMGQKQKREPEIPVTIAMSSELLFNTEQQSPGPGCSFVKALKAVNAKLKECYPESEELFKVLLIHDNSSDLSDRLKEHKLEELITPLSVSGKDLIDKLQEKETHLYLSADELKVQEVLNKGIAAAVMYTPEKTTEVSETQLRVVFDGDAVLFSDESEKVYKEMGLKCFMDHEKENVNKLMKE